MIRQFSSQAEAVASLEDMLAHDSHPKLNATQVARLLSDVARRPDKDERLPIDDGWMPTYDLDAAAAEGWRRKAARVAGDYDFEADESNLKRSQVHKQCLAMADYYTRRITAYGQRITVNRRRTPADIVEEWWALEDEEI